MSAYHFATSRTRLPARTVARRDAIVRKVIGRGALEVARAWMASAASAQSWISSADLTVTRARRAAAADTFGWTVYPALSLGIGASAAAQPEPATTAPSKRRATGRGAIGPPATSSSSASGPASRRSAKAAAAPGKASKAAAAAEIEEQQQWEAKRTRLARVPTSSLPAWWVAAQWPAGELPLREHVLQTAEWLGRGKPSSKRVSFLARDLGMFGAGDVLKTGTSPRRRAPTTGERTTFEQFVADIRRKLETKAEVWGPREHYAAHLEWRLTLARLIGDASAWRQAELAARRNTDGRPPGEGRLDARGQRFLRARLAFRDFGARVKERYRREPLPVLEDSG